MFWGVFWEAWAVRPNGRINPLGELGILGKMMLAAVRRGGAFPFGDDGAAPVRGAAYLGDSDRDGALSAGGDGLADGADGPSFAYKCGFDFGLGGPPEPLLDHTDKVKHDLGFVHNMNPQKHIHCPCYSIIFAGFPVCVWKHCVFQGDGRVWPR